MSVFRQLNNDGPEFFVGPEFLVSTELRLTGHENKLKNPTISHFRYVILLNEAYFILIIVNYTL